MNTVAAVGYLLIATPIAWLQAEAPPKTATVQIPILDLKIVKPVVAGKVAGLDCTVLVATGQADGAVVTTHAEDADGKSPFAKLPNDAIVRIGHAAARLGAHRSWIAPSLDLPVNLISGARFVAGARMVGKAVLLCVNGKFDVYPDLKSVPSSALVGLKGVARIPLHRDAYGRPVCSVVMDGVKIRNCLIDTGCPTSVVDPAAFSKGPAMWSAMLAFSRAPYPVPACGIDFPAFAVDEIRFGPTCSVDDTVVLTQPSVGEGPDAEPRGGPTIGLSTLAKFDWLMDLGRNEFWLRRCEPESDGVARRLTLRVQVNGDRNERLDAQILGISPAHIACGPEQLESMARCTELRYRIAGRAKRDVTVVDPKFLGRFCDIRCPVILDSGSYFTALVAPSTTLGASSYSRATPDALIHIGAQAFPLRCPLASGLGWSLPAAKPELVLGAPTMNGMVVVCRSSELRLYRDFKEIPVAARAQFHGAAKVPLQRDSYGRPMCAVEFDGVKAPRCFIDTGCTISTMDQATFKRGPKAWADRRSHVTLPITIWNGTSWESAFLADRVKIGSAPAVACDLMMLAPEPSDPEDRTVDAGYVPTIGMSTLCRFDWILDLKGKTLWLKTRDAKNGHRAT